MLTFYLFSCFLLCCMCVLCVSLDQSYFESCCCSCFCSCMWPNDWITKNNEWILFSFFMCVHTIYTTRKIWRNHTMARRQTKSRNAKTVRDWPRCKQTKFNKTINAGFLKPRDSFVTANKFYFFTYIRNMLLEKISHKFVRERVEEILIHKIRHKNTMIMECKLTINIITTYSNSMGLIHQC